jgi:hypothetical protein
VLAVDAIDSTGRARQVRDFEVLMSRVQHNATVTFEPVNKTPQQVSLKQNCAGIALLLLMRAWVVRCLDFDVLQAAAAQQRASTFGHEGICPSGRRAQLPSGTITCSLPQSTSLAASAVWSTASRATAASR